MYNQHISHCCQESSHLQTASFSFVGSRACTINLSLIVVRKLAICRLQTSVLGVPEHAQPTYLSSLPGSCPFADCKLRFGGFQSMHNQPICHCCQEVGHFADCKLQFWGFESMHNQPVCPLVLPGSWPFADSELQFGLGGSSACTTNLFLSDVLPGS